MSLLLFFFVLLPCSGLLNDFWLCTDEEACFFVRFHPNNLYIATASSTDKTVRMFRTIDGVPIRLFLGHRFKITAMIFSFDGKYLISGDISGRILFWNIEKGTLFKVIHDLEERVLSLACNSKSTFLSSISYDHCIRIYDLKKLTEKSKFYRKNRKRKKGFSSPELSSSIMLNFSPYFLKYCSSSLVVITTPLPV